MPILFDPSKHVMYPHTPYIRLDSCIHIWASLTSFNPSTLTGFSIHPTGMTLQVSSSSHHMLNLTPLVSIHESENSRTTETLGDPHSAALITTGLFSKHILWSTAWIFDAKADLMASIVQRQSACSTRYFSNAVSETGKHEILTWSNEDEGDNDEDD